MHPSGKKYEIVHDYDLAVVPDSVRDYAKEKGKYAFPKDGSGELIPISTRWRHIQKRGEFKSLGIRDEELLFSNLKHWEAEHCEDGANYPEEKIREIAAWASSPDCEENPTKGIVTCGKPDPEYTGDTITEVPVGHYFGRCCWRPRARVDGWHVHTAEFREDFNQDSSRCRTRWQTSRSPAKRRCICANGTLSFPLAPKWVRLESWKRTELCIERIHHQTRSGLSCPFLASSPRGTRAPYPCRE